ncbi:DUF3267 domain-containing protein [Emticicia agri]|uniref:DUF3267 domain-containing protein n=1 Tax=Emticicia agri TaxID=2492393 RepID=A0A4Q5LTS2_9BACT|nr:DUF3267 domain-containing protein [Emticicia agri]RYU92962.1 DUF3267 domain-containing protein [Emticicia agri]
MKIKPDELTEKGYTLLDQLGHKELVPFIRTYINKRTKYAVLYYCCNVLAFALAGYLLVKKIDEPDISFGDRFTYFSYGLAITFLLVPLHEYIHVLAYKSQGAVNTSYDANFKKFYFLALADKFVANKKEFEIVALAPFIIITTTLVGSLLLVNTIGMLTIAGILLLHTAMCSGDFGLLSYFQFHQDKEVVTYDDKENGITYFYGKSR